MVEKSSADCPQAGSSSKASQVTGNETPPYIYHAVVTGNFSATNHEKVLLASPSSQPLDNVAIRIRYGSAGYIEWLAELQVYLLPNFKHKNILEYHASEVCDDGAGLKFSRPDKCVRFSGETGPRSAESIEMAAISADFETEPNKARRSTSGGPYRAEYWLVTKFCDSMTLRDYLRSNTLTWPQMIQVTKGIMRGLYFLHENHEYQNFDNNQAIDSFISSTNGALRRVAFTDIHHVIHMKPHLNLTIIHRNLSSKNIVIKSDFTPCIWNFGSAYIHHPFQPTNHRHLIDPETKRMHLLSHYSPPEVLQERGHLSLAAMKSIDMYASGIIMWELMSRCVLPCLKSASAREQLERQKPDDYYEPLEREIGPYKGDHSYTDNLVCKRRVRPRLRQGWLAGKNTYRYVQTMSDLWDPDFDARLHPATVLDRMRELSLADQDRHNSFYAPVVDKPPKIKPGVWPDKRVDMCFQAPLATKCGPNIVFGHYSELPVNKKPGWISSDSDAERDRLAASQCQPSTSRQADDSKSKISDSD